MPGQVSPLMKAPSQAPFSAEVHSPNVESETITEENRPGDKYDIEKLTRLDRAADFKDDLSLASPRPSEYGDGDKIIVSFADDDAYNPYNWSMTKKVYIVAASSLLVMNSTISSSIASGVSAPTSEHFHIKDDELLVLPVSIYLVGYVIGPLVFAVSRQRMT